ncbi:MAG: hypothetical protein ACE5KG_02825 [Nitrososphaerales archaeon]
MVSPEEGRKVSVKVSLDPQELTYLTDVLGRSAQDSQVLAQLIRPHIPLFQERVLEENVKALRSRIKVLEKEIKKLEMENENMEAKLKIARSDGAKLTSKVEELEKVRSNLETTWNSKRDSRTRWNLRR